MRRYVWLILIAIVLVGPFVLRRAIGTPSNDQQPARNAPRLIILTPHVEGIKREFADAFSDWHREHFGEPVFIDYRNYGGGTEIAPFFNTNHPLFQSPAPEQ